MGLQEWRVTSFVVVVGNSSSQVPSPLRAPREIKNFAAQPTRILVDTAVVAEISSVFALQAIAQQAVEVAWSFSLISR